MAKDRGEYIIDKDYKILYFNQRIKELFTDAKVGDYCYSALSGRESVCDDCPVLKFIDSDADSAEAACYNPKAGATMESRVSRLKLPGYNECFYISASRMAQDNTDLYGNAVNRFYDELFEINITKNTYKIVYHAENKYVIPPKEGILSDGVANVAENMIHPDDKDRFLNFFRLPELQRQLRQNNNFVSESFRKLLINGDYCWSSLMVLPLDREEESDDNILLCYIMDIHRSKEKEQQEMFLNIRQLSEYDRLTGLCGRAKFFDEAQKLIYAYPDSRFLMSYMDIEHFKLYNDWYGFDKGDELLVSISNKLKQLIAKYPGTAGRFGGDDFAAFFQIGDASPEDIYARAQEWIASFKKDLTFLPAVGLYVVDSPQLSINTISDYAALASKSVKGNYAKRIAWYDEKMSRSLEEEQEIFLEVKDALKNHEFITYVQPKCNMRSGKIVGLEALVRWMHPQKGMIPPGKFIPVLERNGYITYLDKYIWEDICIKMSDFRDKGYELVPVSVNVSRVDIYQEDLIDFLVGLTNKYNLDPSLLELEITESAYMSNFDQLIGVVDRLREKGFVVLMDDFGSGYSSLNMLKNVEVDILKIDMKFLDIDRQNQSKGSSILEAIVRMARWLNYRIIAEGVETKEQMDFLLSIGCEYAQGYYFYRPMPCEEFENSVFDAANIDYTGIVSATFNKISLADLLHDNLINESMLDNILGGVALYEEFEGHYSILSVNDGYYRITGSSSTELYKHQYDIFSVVYPDDYEIAVNILKNAKSSSYSGAEGTFRRYHGDGSIMWMHMHAYFLNERDSRSLYCCTIDDATEDMKAEQELIESQKQLDAVLGISSSEDVSRLHVSNKQVAAGLFSQLVPGGMMGGYCEEGYPIYFANDELIQLLGYDSYADFYDGADGKMINLVHPDDISRIEADLESDRREGVEFDSKHRLRCKDGSYLWMLSKGRIVASDDGRLSIVSVCMNINDTVIAQEHAKQLIKDLRGTNKQLSFLIHNLPDGYYHCDKENDMQILLASDRFLEITGYTMEELKSKFDNKLLNIIYPDDRDFVKKDLSTINVNECHSLQYRIQGKNGILWITDQYKLVTDNGKNIFYGVVQNVTELMDLKRKLEVVVKNTPGDVVRISKGKMEFYSYNLSSSMGYDKDEYMELIKQSKGSCLTYPEDRPKIRAAFAEAEETNSDFCITFRSVRKDKSICWIQLRTSYTEHDHNGTPCYYGIFIDVSETMALKSNMETILQNTPGDISELHISESIWENHPISTGLSVILGYSADEFSQMLLDKSDLPVYPDDVALFNEQQQIAAKTKQDIKFEFRSVAKNGKMRWFQLSAHFVREEKDYLVYHSLITDISAIKETSEKLSFSERRLQTIIDQSGLGIWEYYFKEKRLNIFARPSSHASGSPLFEPFTDNFPESMSDSGILTNESVDTLSRMRKEVESGKRKIRGEICVKANEDKVFWYELAGEVMFESNGTPGYVIGSSRDVTRNKRLELSVKTDSLTGLYNRSTGEIMISDFISKHPASKGIMMMLDLDNFKQINDIYGHVYGDTVLSDEARKIHRQFRDTDIVCRLGGDEFLVFCPGMNTDSARIKAAAICQNLNSVYTRRSHRTNISVSVGIAVYPDDGVTFQELYKKSDIALYQAKLEGKNRFRFFDSEMPKNRVQTSNVRQSSQIMFKDFSKYAEEYILKILYDSDSPEVAIDSVLGLIASHMGADNCYFIMPDNNDCAVWRSDRAAELSDDIIKTIGKCSEQDFDYSFNDTASYNSKDSVSSGIKRIFELSGASVVIQSRGTSGNKVTGILGCMKFDDETPFTKEQELSFKTIADMVGSYIQGIITEKIQKQYINTFTEILDFQDDAICIVDRNFNIIYINKRMRDMYSQTQSGKKCYSSIQHINYICPDCLINALKKSDEKEISKPYVDSKRHIKGHIKCRETTWKDIGCCYIFCVSVEDI